MTLESLERLGERAGQRSCARISDAAEHLGHSDWLGFTGEQELPERPEDKTRHLV